MTRLAIFEVEFWGGMRAQHGGVMHMLPAAGQRALDGQALDIDVGLHQRAQVQRAAADMDRSQDVAIHHARNLLRDTNIGRFGSCTSCS